MKKFLFLFLFFLLFSQFSFADGFKHVQINRDWVLSSEESQFCAINYQDGRQHMLLAIELEKDLKGEEGVWIFPIPANPTKTNIDILKSFPEFGGYDIEKRTSENISNAINFLSFSQIYPMYINFFNIFTLMSGYDAYSRAGSPLIDGVTVHDSIEKMGLTTELVSATDVYSLEVFLSQKGLDLPEKSRKLLDNYIGQEYSFVVSFISDIDAFNEERRSMDDYYYHPRYWHYPNYWTMDSIGVYVDFPTEKIYYPLMLTAIYDELIIPTNIYVAGFVEPILFDEIKNDVKVNYFFDSSLFIQKDLEKFFVGFEKSDSRGDNDFSYIRNIEYTRIQINTESNNFVEDLWIKPTTPQRITLINLVNDNLLIINLLLFVIISMLASLLSAAIVFRKKVFSKTKFALLGLSNFLSILGVIAFSHYLKVNEKFVKNNKTKKTNETNEKIILKATIISLIIPLLILIFIFLIFILPEVISFFSFYYLTETLMLFMFFIFLVIIFAILLFVLIGPLLFFYYKNRDLFKFIILFSIIFILLLFLTNSVIQLLLF